MIHEEVWCPIEGFPLYEVSNLGRVRNVKTGSVRSVQLNHQGFPTLTLYDAPDPTRYVRQVNKLVADAFLPPPLLPNMNAVWHIDGDFTNCQAENLKWDMRARVLEWNEMHRLGVPKLHTDPVMINATGQVFNNAFECGLYVGEIETAIVAHIDRYPEAYIDRAKYRYVPRE